MSTPAFTASDDIVHFIAGQTTPAKSTRFSDVFNPATRRLLRPVAGLKTSLKRVDFAGVV